MCLLFKKKKIKQQLHLAALCDDDGQRRRVARPRRPHRLDLPHDEQRVPDHFPEHHVLPVEPVRLGARQKELTPVGVGARVGRRQQPGAGVLGDKWLVVKLRPVDADRPCSVPFDEVSSLRHEPSDHPVEAGTLVADGETVARAELARAELSEVFGGSGRDVGEELHRDPSRRDVSDRDV